MSEHLDHLATFERNQAWFLAHERELLRRYPERFVAVWNEEVIADGEDPADLRHKVDALVGPVVGAYFDYVTDTPLEMIL